MDLLENLTQDQVRVVILVTAVIGLANTVLNLVFGRRLGVVNKNVNGTVAKIAQMSEELGYLKGHAASIAEAAEHSRHKE